MAKKELIDYMRQNKDKYGIEMLRSELLKAGYTDAEIREAEAELSSPPAPLAPQAPPRVETPVIASTPTPTQAPAGVSQGIAGKSFIWYWEIAKLPIIIVVAWAGAVWLLGLIPVVGFIFPLMDIVIGWLLSIGAAIWVGYTAVKKQNATLLQALVAGAIGGILAGVGRAIFDVLGVMVHPSLGSSLFSLFSLIWVPLGESTLWLVVSVVVAALLGAGKSQTAPSK